MIDKREILEVSSTLKLQPSVVEKDYVLGWLLAGINAHPELSDIWIFKGGTCLKKCFFETYRFSEDLDFTLRDAAQLEEGFLRRCLEEVVSWVHDESGLNVPPNQIGIDVYDNPRGGKSCQGKVGYRGPVSPSSGGWPKIKLDLTADERLVLPHVRSEVFHPYSDRPDAGIWINSYAYEEAFGEKVRALGERTRPRDLYDVINLYRHGDSRPSAAVLRDVLRQKCDYKGIDLPTIDALRPHRADLEAMWENMLAHQLPVLPPVADFWDALPEVFDWIMGGEQAPALVRIAPSAEETTIFNRVLPLGIPMRARGPMEVIRFAAANHLCVDLDYDGKTRRIEPYSLRQTRDGNFVLHAIRRDSTEHRSYRVDRIQGASVAQEGFAPRYVMELTASGALQVAAASRSTSILPTASRKKASGRGSAGMFSSGGPTYVYQCPICRKTFDRKSMDGTLNAHKTPNGYPCAGRYGTYLRTKY